VYQHPNGNVVDPRLVPLDKLLERITIAAARAVHKPTVVRVSVTMEPSYRLRH